MPPPLIAMRGVSKRYGGVAALKGVDFEARQGEITCLLGENGAGKSTLMKILAGAVPDYEGELQWEGSPFSLSGPAAARERGIALVHQELTLAPNLSAAENLRLEAEGGGRASWFLDRAAMAREAAAALAALDPQLDVHTPVGGLGLAAQQSVEIARALRLNPRLLILDEPTSSLSIAESGKLFSILRGLRLKGLAIIYISHKLSEIRELGDRVVCLRDGKNAGEADPKLATEAQLVAMMVGRDLEPQRGGGAATAGEAALELEGLSGPPWIEGVSFTLRRGEILGLAGIMGAGRSELAGLIIGAARPRGGSLRAGGLELKPGDPAASAAAGIAYVPEDRKTQGLVRGLSVQEQLALGAPGRVAGPLGLNRPGRALALARRFIGRLGIKASPDSDAFQLSGGNQQKVVLARCLAARPSVLILDEPTRGIDVGAKAEVHRIILDLARKGLAVLLISSELPEILALSDRVLVMRQGRLAGEFSGAGMTEAAIMAAAVGSKN